MTKICKCCSEEKPKSEFYKMKRSNDGLHYYCKSCCKVHRSRENVRKRDKKSKISNRQQYRAKINNIQADIDITLDGLYKRDHGKCGICGEFVMPKHASIDHIKPIIKGGTHTWDNVQLVHIKCNLRKGSN